MNIGVGGIGTGFDISGSGFLVVAQAVKLTSTAIATALSKPFMWRPRVIARYARLHYSGAPGKRMQQFQSGHLISQVGLIAARDGLIEFSNLIETQTTALGDFLTE